MMLAVAIAGESESAFHAAAFGLLLIAMRPLDARLAAMRVLGPIRACGRRCYSIYLVHLPVCIMAVAACRTMLPESFWARTFVALPLASALGLLTAWGFYPRGRVAVPERSRMVDPA